MTPLLDMLKTNPATVDELSIQQVLSLSGKDKLGNGSNSSEGLRAYLKVAKIEHLAKYIDGCLGPDKFEGNGYVFQDIVNEFGRRLDYSVVDGLYQGKVGANGFDGLWKDSDGGAIVVEAKISDAYRITLATCNGYREKLIKDGTIGPDSSILIVVGRFDTGELEAQVRGSRHAWTTRIISIDALAQLALLKQDAGEGIGHKIHSVLTPFEYTRVDRIIELAFTVKEDIKNEEEVPGSMVSDPVIGKQQQHTPSDVVAKVRANIVSALISKYVPLVKKSRALYWSADKSVRAAITISKEYADTGFWYAYHPAWDTFLADAKQGFYVLGCIGRKEAYAIPFDWFHKQTHSLHSTKEGDGVLHWHVLVYPASATDKTLVLHLKDGKKEPLAAFKIETP